ncbi:MAG: CpcT/CpeT family chromophore lyase [Polyangiales bacterium]
MRHAMLGLMIIPGIVGVNVLGRSARVADAAPSNRASAVFAEQVAAALSGSFIAAPQRTADGTRPAVERTACRVSAPGLGPNVLYVEDAFVGRRARPFAQRLLAVDPHAEGAVVREFSAIDPESMVGLCASEAPPTVYRANTVERRGCEITLRRNGTVVQGATTPARCESRINDAQHVERTMRVGENGVDFAERGVDARGRVVWGGPSSTIRFLRR